MVFGTAGTMLERFAGLKSTAGETSGQYNRVNLAQSSSPRALREFLDNDSQKAGHFQARDAPFRARRTRLSTAF